MTGRIARRMIYLVWGYVGVLVCIPLFVPGGGGGDVDASPIFPRPLYFDSRAASPTLDPVSYLPTYPRTSVCACAYCNPFPPLSVWVVQCGGDGYTGPTCCRPGYECEPVADCFSEVRT